MDIYYEAYYYFKLQDDYLQVIQSNGAIPYPSVLKENGKKFFFSEIKELVFFKDIEVMEERYNDEDISETVYSCKIILKDGGSIKNQKLDILGRKEQKESDQSL